jgi:hypothetical protein
VKRGSWPAKILGLFVLIEVVEHLSEAYDALVVEDLKDGRDVGEGALVEDLKLGVKRP